MLLSCDYAIPCRKSITIYVSKIWFGTWCVDSSSYVGNAWLSTRFIWYLADFAADAGNLYFRLRANNHIEVLVMKGIYPAQLWNACDWLLMKVMCQWIARTCVHWHWWSSIVDKLNSSCLLTSMKFANMNCQMIDMMNWHLDIRIGWTWSRSMSCAYECELLVSWIVAHLYEDVDLPGLLAAINVVIG